MRRCSFSTFQISHANRGAVELCRAVAALEPVAPMPVILVGEEGCGKTHLLYAIVNAVRADSARTGLAYVTARDFPEEVRSLLDEPGLVARAEAAILLVDQLEDFREHTDELEAVTRLFIANGHSVVMASSVHPGRLKNLPASFQELLACGRVVRMEPRIALEQAPAAPPEPPRPVALKPANPRPAGQRPAGPRFGRRASDRRAFQESPGRAYWSPPAPSAGEQESSQLLWEFEFQQARLDNLEADLARERAEKEELSGELMRLRAEALVRSEAPGLKQATPEPEPAGSAARAEAARLQEELRRVEAERDASLRDRAALEAMLAHQTEAAQETESLQRRLEEARAERDAAQREAGFLIERVQVLADQVETSSAQFAQVEQHQRDRIHNLEELLQQLAARPGSLPQGAADSKAQAEAWRTEMLRARDNLAGQLHEAKREAETTAAARDAALAKLDDLTARHAALEIETESLRQELASRAATMEVLRQEAAAQAAGTDAGTGEEDRRYASALEDLARARRVNRMLAEGITSVQNQLGGTSGMLAQLERLLGSAPESADAIPQPGACEGAGSAPMPEVKDPETPSAEAFAEARRALLKEADGSGA